MQFFLKYIRQQKKIISVFLLFCAIFAVIFMLYHLPLKAVIYPSLICLLIGAVFCIFDYFKAKHRHYELQRLSCLTYSMINELPEEIRIDNNDYQQIIRALQKETAEIVSEADIRYSDMIDYYTVWAHQIKTPIASMRLTLYNEDTAESRKLRSDLFRIEQYADMVLAFLRLDSVSSDYVFKEYPLDPIIRQSVKKFSQEFIARKISLNCCQTGISVITDDKWLSFVLEQIISNALKYTHEGCIKIFMSGQKMLCIEDSGIGIAPEDLPRIFEKGYTGYNGRTDKKASGIGLYLCKRICDNLGIEIYAQSEIGKGTIISLNLDQYKLRRE